MWLRRHFVAFVILFAALVTIADGSLTRAETHRIEEPCGVALIGACLPRKVVAWERTQGTIVENVQGFTLLELAIVLTVIGLIVGGILWGADMIGAAATRAQISQVEKFNTAANAFVTKYGYLPGDIPDPYASQFGFKPRGSVTGTGDGDGNLLGYNGGAAGNQQTGGETVMFWVDLSMAGMLDGGFTAATSTGYNNISSAQLPLYFPAAKIGNGNYCYVYNGGYWNGAAWIGNGYNYFGIEQMSVVYLSGPVSTPGLTVSQAYSIDKKIDDGLPQSGAVIATYINQNLMWMDTTVAYQNPPVTSQTNGTSATCYDNGGIAGPQHYSLEIKNGSGVNCALSFKMNAAR